MQRAGKHKPVSSPDKSARTWSWPQETLGLSGQHMACLLPHLQPHAAGTGQVVSQAAPCACTHACTSVRN